MQEPIQYLRLSTPGRVCFFGEHQDYLQLPVIACAISRRISIDAKHRADRQMIIDLPDIRRTSRIDLNTPLKYESRRDYFRSGLTVMQRHGFSFSAGLDCEVRGNIPINSGTSSSSALVVSWINLLALMSDQRKGLSPEECGTFAYEAEVVEFNEPGGMMDQLTTAVGGIVHIQFHPSMGLDHLPAQIGTFVLGDSCELKDTQGILQRVRNQVTSISTHIALTHKEFSLQTVALSDLNRYKVMMNHEQATLLDGTIRNRDITGKARAMLKADVSDHRGIGRMLTEHQEILRDVLKISTPKIDRMLEGALEAGALGGKINGSGGGGCMFAYTPTNAEVVVEAIEKAGGRAHIIQPDVGTTIEAMEV